MLLLSCLFSGIPSILYDIKDNAAKAQLLRDRANAEHAQAKGHNQRVKVKYPQVWADSDITNDNLTDWIKEHKGQPCPYHAQDDVQAAVEVDHKLPLARGGSHSFDNLQMLCLDCNRSKGDKLESEFLAWREAQPRVFKFDKSNIQFYETKNNKPRLRIRSLFLETNRTDLPSVYSLDNREHREGLYSFPKLYLEIADPTEYNVAVSLFDGIEHLGYLCREPWFQSRLNALRDELRAKLKSEMVMALIAEAKDGNLGAIKQALQDQHLVFSPYLDPTEVEVKNRVGRPCKPKDDNTIPDEILSEDSLRIGL